MSSMEEREKSPGLQICDAAAIVESNGEGERERDEERRGEKIFSHAVFAQGNYITEWTRPTIQTDTFLF